MSMTCRNLSRPTMTRVTGRQRAWQMDEKGVSSRARSCRKSEFSCGATRAHQQREDAVYEGCLTNLSTEIMKDSKVMGRRPRAVYELEDLNDTPIEDQFYRVELTPVRITDRTSYKIDKILDKRVKCGIREYLVRWRGYSQYFDSWVPAISVKNIYTRLRPTAIFTSHSSATRGAKFMNRIHTPISR